MTEVSDMRRRIQRYPYHVHISQCAGASRYLDSLALDLGITITASSAQSVGGGLLQSFGDFCLSVHLFVCPSIRPSEPSCVKWYGTGHPRES